MLLQFCKENSNTFLLGTEIYAFLLKESVRGGRKCTSSLKTWPKSAQEVEFSKLQKLLMEGWVSHSSVMIILISYCLPKAQVQYIQSHVRSKWENSTLNRLTCNKNEDLLPSILYESPKLQFKINTSCPINCYGHEEEQIFISLKS